MNISRNGERLSTSFASTKGRELSSALASADLSQLTKESGQTGAALGGVATKALTSRFGAPVSNALAPIGAKAGDAIEDNLAEKWDALKDKIRIWRSGGQEKTSGLLGGIAGAATGAMLGRKVAPGLLGTLAGGYLGYQAGGKLQDYLSKNPKAQQMAGLAGAGLGAAGLAVGIGNKYKMPTPLNNYALPASANAAPAGATNPIGSSMGIPELQGHISNLDPQKRQELLNWLIQNGAQ